MSLLATAGSAVTRVLLVEDNPGDAELFRAALSGASLARFEVETVGRMSEGIERAATGTFDVVVLDLSLPDSFGMDTLQTMRGAVPLTPIVVLTGGGDDRVGLDALTKGAQDYLVKGDITGGTIARALLFAIERRLLQEQLSRGDELLAEAQKIAALGSFEWDVARNHLTWSDELQRIYGVSNGGANPTYEGFLAHVHADDRERVHQVLQAALEANTTFDCEYRVPRAADTRILHTRGRVALDGPGPPKRVLGVCQDITERRKLEGTLILAGRMSSVGTLASGIAHEINNPLSSVLANLEFLGKELRGLTGVPTSDLLGELTELVKDASLGAERVRVIVRGLKTFSRADLDERRVPVELEAVLEVAITLTVNEIRSRARLVKEFGPCPSVEADEARMSQVFVNLLLNAAQAIGDGLHEDDEIRVTTSTDSAGRAVVQIRDTGCGISEGDRAQIFDPFFTTKPVGTGPGLGLSIAHGIITAHGGELVLEKSTLGEGTTFRVVLPAAVPDAHPVHPPAPAPSVAPPKRRGRILIIDDEPLVSTALRRILAPEHDVEVSGGGRHATARLDGGERFDVIFCDIMMPGMDGMALHAQLSRSIPDQADKVLFVTGGAVTAKTKAFLDQVSHPWVEKPFNPASVRALVRGLVR